MATSLTYDPPNAGFSKLSKNPFIKVLGENLSLNLFSVSFFWQPKFAENEF